MIKCVRCINTAALVLGDKYAILAHRGGCCLFVWHIVDFQLANMKNNGLK